MTMLKDELITIDEFCEMTGITRFKFRQLKLANTLPPLYRFGGVYRIRRDDVRPWFEKLRVNTAQMADA